MSLIQSLVQYHLIGIKCHVGFLPGKWDSYLVCVVPLAMATQLHGPLKLFTAYFTLTHAHCEMCTLDVLDECGSARKTCTTNLTEDGSRSWVSGLTPHH